MIASEKSDLAFVFPGQGAQSVGMLDAFLAPSFAHHAVIAQAQAQADAALGESLSSLINSGPTENLSLTVNTQPAMLLAGYAAFAAWQAMGGPAARAMAGHSLGEYTALVAAQAISLPDAIKLVRLRASAMQSAVPVGTGSMAAILGLDDATVKAVCEAAAQGQIVEPANFNAPSQVVISGHVGAVQRACEGAKAAGAKRALPLAVSAPFHCSLLKPAGDKLALALAELIKGDKLKAPVTSVVNNIDAASPSSVAEIADALVRQSWGPVRWVDLILHLRSLGITKIVEFGPGKVLTGLIPRIDKSMSAYPVFDPASLDAALAAVNA